MTPEVNEVMDAALKLSEAERLIVAARLMETISSDLSGLSDDDPNFLDELERRAGDNAPGIPISELWKRD
jgi:hypothetical protein